MNYFKKKVALALTMSMVFTSIPVTSLASDKGFDISENLDKVDTNIGDSANLLKEKSKDFAESLKKIIESGSTDELIESINKSKEDFEGVEKNNTESTTTHNGTEGLNRPQIMGHVNVTYIDARNRREVGKQVLNISKQGENTVKLVPPNGFKFENELDSELTVNAKHFSDEIYITVKVIPSIINNVDDIYSEPKTGLNPPIVNEPEIDESYILDRIQSEYDREDPEEIKKYYKEKLEEFKKYLDETKALVIENTDTLFRNKERYRDDQTLNKSLEDLIHEIEREATPKETIKAEVDSLYDYMKIKSNMVFMDWLTSMIYNQEVDPIEVRNTVEDLSKYTEKYTEVLEIANIYRENRSELTELVFRNYNELLAQHVNENDLAITVNKKMSNDLLEKSDIMLKDLLFAKAEMVNAISEIRVKEIPTYKIEEWASSFAEYSAQIESLKDLEVDKYYEYLKTELNDLSEIIIKLNSAKDKQDKVFELSNLLEAYDFQFYKVKSLIELAPEFVTIAGSFNNTGNAEVFLNSIMSGFENATGVEDIKVALDKNKAISMLYIKSGDLNALKYNAYLAYSTSNYEELTSKETRIKHELYKSQMLNKLYEIVDKIEEPKISKEKVKLVTDLSKLLSLKSNSSIDSEAAKTFISLKFKFKNPEKQEEYDKVYKLAEKLSKIHDQQEISGEIPAHIKKINDKYEEYATIDNILKEDVGDLSVRLDNDLNELKIWDKGLDTEIDFSKAGKEIYNFYKLKLKSENSTYDNPITVFSQETINEAQAYVDGYSKNMSLVRNSESIVVNELMNNLGIIKKLQKSKEIGIDFETYHKTINNINELLKTLKQDKLDNDKAIELIFAKVKSSAESQGIEKEGIDEDLQSAVAQFKKLVSSNFGKERDFVIMAKLFADKYTMYLEGEIEKPAIFEFDEKVYKTQQVPEIPKVDEPKNPDPSKTEEPPKPSPGVISGGSSSGGGSSRKDKDKEARQYQGNPGTSKLSDSDNLVVGKIELLNTPATTFNYDLIKLEGVAEGKWYTMAFKKMAQRGYIKNKKYNPDAEATRAFVVGTLSMISQKGRVASSNPFVDVKNANLKNALNWAVASGIVTVGKDKKFNPQAPITRAQMAVLIDKFVNINVLNLVPNKNIPEYKDPKLPKWAKESIYNVSKLGYMTPDKNGKFNPDKRMTNSEFITLMERVITDLGL